MIPAILLAVLALVLASAIDFLLKFKKVTSYFSFAGGFAVGFAFYFHTEATPLTGFNLLVTDLFIGGIIGLVFGAAFLYALAPLWNTINRKLKIIV